METPAARFRAAIELRTATIEMHRQRLLREHPDLSREQIANRLEAWVVGSGAPATSDPKPSRREGTEASS